MWQLITIPFSHYCEKARWALDLGKFDYKERGYVPGTHLLATRLRGRGNSVPVLVADDVCLTDSTDILKFLDAQPHAGPRLYPTTPAGRPTVAELEDWCDEELGRASRVYAYSELLPEPKRLLRLLGHAFPLPQRVLFRFALPYVSPLIRDLYRIKPDNAEKAVATIRDAFKRAGALLRETNAFLAGDTFTAADLSFASLAAPVLLYPSMATRRGEEPRDDEILDAITPAYRELVKELRNTAAGEHARRVYAEWRH